MTKKHFQAMAEIVKSILEGKWTSEAPSWAVDIDGTTAVTRAVQTAEVFIILAERFNPRFDRDRFLQACGLITKPAKVRKSRTS